MTATDRDVQAAHRTDGVGRDADLRLTVYFDAGCRLCALLRSWLEAQPQLVPLDFVAAQGASDYECPIDAERLLERITVIASDGAIYRGVNAWIICLWALEKYRSWSLTLSRPALLPWARRLCDLVTRNRHRFGRIDPHA